ncbi:hypothetical protein [Streptomyces sp. NBC_01236]|uniref:hypothetical protein n=1 Tax=Streptomyces sp. NBC_01236 TaxID=2903789 RepID=UPI002E0D2163|nr:hypothetical protein OG324_12430 [Streptomyces sp. NBC_01236]
MQGELEILRIELVAAREVGDTQAADDVQAEWRGRLRRTLRADPEVVDELLALLAELEATAAEQSKGNVCNTISGGVQHGTVVRPRRSAI